MRPESVQNPTTNDRGMANVNVGNESAARGCVDCESLKGGQRHWPGPHQYLVASGRFGKVSSHEYRCLVCKTVLVCEGGERGEVWKNWAPETVSSPAAPAAAPHAASCPDV